MKKELLSHLRKTLAQSSARGLCFRGEFTGPDAVWRFMFGVRIMFYLIVVGTALLIAVMFIGMANGWFRISYWWMLIPCVLGVATRLYAYWTLKRLVRSIEESGFHLCLNCGYCLYGLHSNHFCPECGNAYEIEQVEQRWHEWVQSLNMSGLCRF